MGGAWATAMGLIFCAVFASGSASLAPGQATGQPSAPGSQSPSPAIRPVGVVTQIGTGSFTLRTDAGPELAVQLPEGVAVLRVPPGSKDLKAATKISVTDISTGDRVLVRGKLSDDQKSVAATSVIVMTRADIASAHDAERLEWQRRSVGGLVKAVNPEAKELTISVPSTPPTPGNPTHPMTISLAPNAALLRYAPGSVKFSDANPGTFDQIRVGDQVRALGTKSEDGSKFTAEKMVSGSFRNIAATVISVDAPNGAVTVKDLASGKPVLVKTNADSKLHTLPQFIAMMIANFNAGQMPGGTMQGRPAGGESPAGAAGGRPAGGGPGGAGPGGMGGRFGGGGQGGGFGGAPRDFNQMLERTPALLLGDLKHDDAVIVVSTEGALPSEVTAIVLLAGVEPILAARPKGSNDVNLGPWNMSMGGADTGP